MGIKGDMTDRTRISRYIRKARSRGVMTYSRYMIARKLVGQKRAAMSLSAAICESFTLQTARNRSTYPHRKCLGTDNQVFESLPPLEQGMIFPLLRTPACVYRHL